MKVFFLSSKESQSGNDYSVSQLVVSSLLSSYDWQSGRNWRRERKDVTVSQSNGGVSNANEVFSPSFLTAKSFFCWRMFDSSFKAGEELSGLTWEEERLTPTRANTLLTQRTVNFFHFCYLMVFLKMMRFTFPFFSFSPLIDFLPQKKVGQQPALPVSLHSCPDNQSSSSRFSNVFLLYSLIIILSLTS